jgi:hypothetical protein
MDPALGEAKALISGQAWLGGVGGVKPDNGEN